MPSSFPNKVHLAAMSAAGAIIVIASFTAASRSSLLATFNEAAIATGRARRLLQDPFPIDQMPKPASYSKMLLGLEDEARMLAYTYQNIFRLGEHAGESQTDEDGLNNTHIMIMSNMAAGTGMAKTGTNELRRNQTASDDEILIAGNNSDSNGTRGARLHAAVSPSDNGTPPCNIMSNCTEADEEVGLIQESEPTPPFSSSSDNFTLAQAQQVSNNATADSIIPVDPDVTRPAKYIEEDEMLKPATYEKIFGVKDEQIGDSAAENRNATLPATLSRGNNSSLTESNGHQKENRITNTNNIASESDGMADSMNMSMATN